jgi:hypothetical protein
MRAALLCLLLVAFAPASPAAPLSDAMRGNTSLEDEPRPPPLANQENKDVRRNRAFAMQPPTIPHRIDGYQVDRNANRCLGCHSRTRIEETQAIPTPARRHLAAPLFLHAMPRPPGRSEAAGGQRLPGFRGDLASGRQGRRRGAEEEVSAA